MLILNVVALLIAVPMMTSLGREFMPPLDEGSLLYMPVTLPAINITEARRIIQVQDAIIARHPAVRYVLGKVGRAETATDPAPVSMFETIIELKPKSEWPAGMTSGPTAIPCAIEERTRHTVDMIVHGLLRPEKAAPRPFLGRIGQRERRRHRTADLAGSRGLCRRQ